MDEDDIARIAARVTLLMQLDRLQGALPGEPGRAGDGAGDNRDGGADPGAGPEAGPATGPDLGPDLGAGPQVLANLPEHLTSVFEAAGEITGEPSPAELGRLLNRRLARLEAQLYLLRLQLLEPAGRDPARVLEDPLVIAAQGERIAGLTTGVRQFHFDTAILAHGWYPIEHHQGRPFRWMRQQQDGAAAVAAIPHLGQVPQLVEVEGYLLDPAQYEGFTISAAGVAAEITPERDQPRRFTARLRLPAAALPSPRYLPISFRLQQFRQPNAQDPRLLGANIQRFTCRPLEQA